MMVAQQPMEDLRATASSIAMTNEQSALFGLLHGRSERIARMCLSAVIAREAYFLIPDTDTGMP